MSKVKSVSTYNGSAWGAAVPLGADDENIDITTNTTQPDGSAVSGVTDDSNIALDTTAVEVASGDTSASAWTKFNRFRKRVINNLANYIPINKIITSNGQLNWYPGTPTDDKIYSALNIAYYFNNVIGYTGTPTAGTVADQLATKIIYFTCTINPPAANSSSIYTTTSVTVSGCTSDHKLLVFDTNEPEYLVGNTYYWTTDTNSLQVQVAVSSATDFYGVLIKT